jgi:signal transduction histidine kinase
MTAPRKIFFLVFCLLLLTLLEYLGLFSGMNTYFYDLAFRIRGPRAPLDRIVIVAIDEKTLETLGRWPLRRSLYASILEKTAAADVVAFDVMMVEPSTDDAVFANKMREYGKTMLPVSIETDMSIALPAPAFSPVPAGHVHIERGIDGIVRDVFHTIDFQGRRLPSFASRIYEIAGWPPFSRGAPVIGKPDATGDIVQSDPMRINYYGGPGTFLHLSFLDVFNGIYPREYFQGKIVLVGITAMGLVDSATTPYSETRMGTAGVEIQANILSNLFQGNAIRTVPTGARWLIGGLLAVLMYWLFIRISEAWSAVLLIAVLAACSVIVFVLFANRHVWYDPAGTYLSMLAVLVLAYIYKLNDAALSLGLTYAAIRPHLRKTGTREMPGPVGSGLSGILTPKGIQAQAFVLNDITHQLIFEKELSDRILLSDVFGVAVFDPDGRLIMANKDIHELCTANAIALDDRDRFIAGLALHVMEKEKSDPVFEQWLKMTSITLFLAKPQKRYLKVDLSVLSVGQSRYALFILSDITKIKELEILKSQIVSIVSHELKTPMTNIQGFSELLVESLDGEMHQFAGIILEESVRLTKFVNLFLDINRIEEGRQQIRKTPVQLSALIRQAALKMQPIANKKGVAVEAEVFDEAAPVLIDRELTEQAILNLAENAVKYSPQGSRVTIRLTDGPETAGIDVADNGYGIREEDLLRIFEKFYRANAETSEDVKGSGLGLTFVKEAVEAQGGRISVASTFGEGSTFSLVFPKTGPGSAS